MAEANNKKPTIKRIRIERQFPDDLESHFVSSIVVQHQPDYFIVSFFEVFPPPILGDTDEERLAELEALDTVEAKCVARLVVPPSKMKEFVAVMSENLENYQRHFTDDVQDASTE